MVTDKIYFMQIKKIQGSVHAVVRVVVRSACARVATASEFVKLK
jgi:hypothetical protein